MKKIIFLSCILILAYANLNAQSYNAPESAVYDATSNRYFVSNAGSGVIIQVNGNTGVKANFKTGLTGPKGMVIVSGKLFVTDVTSVLGYNVSTGLQVMNLPITGASFLNDIESNGSNYLYVSDMNANAIIRIDITNVASPTYTTFVSSGITSPNGLIHDAVNSRLILVSFRSSSPIQAINTSTAAVTTIISTSLNNLDGITRDDTGNYYISSWGTNIVYKYNSTFSNSPVAYYTGFNGPADIYYNPTSKVFVVPDMNNNKVMFTNFHLPLINPSASVYKCPGKAVTLQTYNGAGLTYQWQRNGSNTGSNSYSLNATLAGSYTVTTTNIGGSNTSGAVSVIDYTVPTKPVITALDTTNFCSGDSVTLQAPAGFRYVWSTKDTLRNITVRNKGKYAVYVIDNHGCSSPASDSTTVNVYPDIIKPIILLTGNNPFCKGDSIILSGPSGYSYLWSNSKITQSITVKSKGAFRLQISQSGCPSDWSDTFFADTLSGASKPIITIDGSTQFCKGDSVKLSGPPGFNYLWSTNATTVSITVKNSGKFTLRISKGSCTSDLSDTIEVKVKELPVIQISKIPEKCLNGGIIALNNYLTVDGKPTSLGIWSSPSTGLIYGDKFNPIAAGASTPPGWKVKYEYTDPLTACFKRDSSYITVFPLPAKPIIIAAPDSSFCQGDSITLTAPNGYPKYLWSIDSLSTLSIMVDYSDTVFLQITDTNGCKNAGNIIVTERLKPTKPIVIDSSTFLKSSIKGKSYIWYKRVPGSIKELLSLHTRTIDPKPICTNCYYSVIVEDSFGCLSDTSDERLFLVTGINSIENSKVSIFPNPATNILNIRVHQSSLLKQNLNLIITDLNGRTCYQQLIDQEYSVINIVHLANGIYLLKISGKDYIYNSKFVMTN